MLEHLGFGMNPYAEQEALLAELLKLYSNKDTLITDLNTLAKKTKKTSLEGESASDYQFHITQNASFIFATTPKNTNDSNVDDTKQTAPSHHLQRINRYTQKTFSKVFNWLLAYAFIIWLVYISQKLFALSISHLFLFVAPAIGVVGFSLLLLTFEYFQLKYQNHKINALKEAATQNLNNIKYLSTQEDNAEAQGLLTQLLLLKQLNIDISSFKAPDGVLSTEAEYENFAIYDLFPKIEKQHKRREKFSKWLGFFNGLYISLSILWLFIFAGLLAFTASFTPTLAAILCIGFSLWASHYEVNRERKNYQQLLQLFEENKPHLFQIWLLKTKGFSHDDFEFGWKTKDIANTLLFLETGKSKKALPKAAWRKNIDILIISFKNFYTPLYVLTALFAVGGITVQVDGLLSASVAQLSLPLFSSISILIGLFYIGFMLYHYHLEVKYNEQYLYFKNAEIIAQCFISLPANVQKNSAAPPVVPVQASLTATTGETKEATLPPKNGMQGYYFFDKQHRKHLMVAESKRKAAEDKDDPDSGDEDDDIEFIERPTFAAKR